MIFCDTSTLAKFYLLEPEMPAVRAVFEAAPKICASELARVEVMAVFHRRLREKKCSRPDFQNAINQFIRDDLADYWTWLPLAPAITEAAARTFMTLSPAVFLRASDCIHIATALHNKFDTIHTHDIHQAAAAATLGLKTIAL